MIRLVEVEMSVTLRGLLNGSFNRLGLSLGDPRGVLFVDGEGVASCEFASMVLVPVVFSFGRGVESPDKFMLLIEWQTMDAHVAFTRDPSFTEFRAILAPFTKGGSMEHFTME